MDRKQITIVFLTALTAIGLYLCYLLFQPFLYPALSAIVIAVVFFPVHTAIHRMIRGPSLSALLSTVLVILIFIVPGILVLVAVTQEVSALYSFLSHKSTESGGLSPFLSHLLEKPLQWAGRFVDLSKFDLQAALVSRLQQLSTFLLDTVGLLLGSVSSILLNAVITIFTLFFLFREGRATRRRLAAILPLSPEQVEGLFSGIEHTIVGTVYGGLVIAAVQGVIVGLALWVFGVPSPVLLGLLAAFCSLLPVVGSALVWAPAALYLIIAGHWVQGLILAGWSTGAAAVIDNLLRPYIIGGRVQMHPLLIFFSVFGGVEVFGLLGLVVGPLIVAVTMTLLSIVRDESRGWGVSSGNALPDSGASPPSDAPSHPPASEGAQESVPAICE